MSKETQKIYWEIVANLLPKIIYRIEIPLETKNKIDEIKKILNENPDLNIITYFNHISFEDSLFVGHIIKKIDPKNTRPILVPVSYSHTDASKKENKFSIKMIEIANSCGVETVRTIQTYQTIGLTPLYTTEKANIINRNLFDQIKKYKKYKSPFIFAISPEGHRSEDGKLGKGETSMAGFANHLQPSLLIPVGINYSDNFCRDKLNLGKKVILTIGDLYINEGKEKKDIDFYMNKLALTLPPQMRGKYNPSNNH